MKSFECKNIHGPSSPQNMKIIDLNIYSLKYLYEWNEFMLLDPHTPHTWQTD